MYFSDIGRSALIVSAGSHSHDEWELVLNLEGDGMARIGDCSQAFTAGTVMCLPPGTPHAKTAPHGFRDIYMHFPRLPLPEDSPYLTFEDEDRRVEQLLIMIHSIYHKRENHYKEITDALASALEQILVGRVATATVDPRVARVADLAVEHFSDPEFSISQAITECGYCEDHLRRLFRRRFGETPSEYLPTLRIHFAKKLMHNNRHMHYTVAEIGTMAGFSDISYFSRVFKKRTGLSPRDYLRSQS